MSELKTALDTLIKAIIVLEEGVSRVNAKEIKCNTKQIELTRSIEANKIKVEELDKREKGIKHIEDIDKALVDSKRAIVDADKAKSAQEKSTNAHIAQVTEDRKKQAAEWKKIDDAEINNKKQADALRQERKDFNAKVTAAKAMAQAIK